MPILLSSDPPLSVVTAGDDRRPALLVLNPLATTLEVWDPMMPRLLEHNHVVRFDMRGHGHSGPISGPVELADLAEDALHVLDSLEIARASVIGASLGGMVAATLAADHPDRIDRLVLVATSVRLGPDYWWQRTIDTVESDGLDGVVDHLHSILFSPRWAEADPEGLAAARQMFLATPTESYLAGARAILASDLGPKLDAIRASTLLVVGSEDPVLRHHPAEDLLARIPDSEAVVVDGASHRVFVEYPVEIAEVVGEFLTDPDGR